MGRPPGSKNKPKIDPLPPPNRSLISSTDNPGMRRFEGVFIPPEWDDDPPIELSATDPVKVTLRMKGRAFGDDAKEEQIIWPAEWRLPLAGEAIHLSKEFGGFVEYVDFLVAEKQIVVNLR